VKILNCVKLRVSTHRHRFYSVSGIDGLIGGLTKEILQSTFKPMLVEANGGEESDIF